MILRKNRITQSRDIGEDRIKMTLVQDKGKGQNDNKLKY